MYRGVQLLYCHMHVGGNYLTKHGSENLGNPGIFLALVWEILATSGKGRKRSYWFVNISLIIGIFQKMFI